MRATHQRSRAVWLLMFDVKRNGFTGDTEEEINEIVTKNFLKSQNIRYNRLGDNVGRVVGTEEENIGQVSSGLNITLLSSN